MHKTPTILFFFKKNTPLLRDIIPNDYIDIHSHLLPGIDDGAKNFNQTLELITQLKAIGFKDFITTPHVMSHVWENTKLDIENNFAKTAKELNQKEVTNYFHTAAEYMIDDDFRKLFMKESLLTIKDNYVLVEMSYLNAPLQLFDILFDLQVAGYKPVLAHPERYTFYHNNIDDYKKLKRAGCLFQLNLLSTVNYYGTQVANTADSLLKNNLIDFVGSDVHHKKHIAFFDKKIVLKNTEPIKEAFQNNFIFKP